jgi:hypothetical protein
MRDEELPELDELARACPFDPRGGAESKQGKANILLQVRPAGTLPGWQPGYHWRGSTIDTLVPRCSSWPPQLHHGEAAQPPGLSSYIAAPRLAAATSPQLAWPPRPPLRYYLHCISTSARAPLPPHSVGLHQPRAHGVVQPERRPQLRGIKRPPAGARPLRDLRAPRLVVGSGALPHPQQGEPPHAPLHVLSALPKPDAALDVVPPSCTCACARVQAQKWGARAARPDRPPHPPVPRSRLSAGCGRSSTRCGSSRAALACGSSC